MCDGWSVGVDPLRRSAFASGVCMRPTSAMLENSSDIAHVNIKSCLE